MRRTLLAVLLVGGVVAAAPASAATRHAVNVRKVGTLFDSFWVDANGDGVYNNIETARTAAAPVSFEISVFNGGSSPAPVQAITIDNQALPAACAALVGVNVKPGFSATCLWTVNKYSPTSGGAVLSTATLVMNGNTVVTGNKVSTA